MNTSNESNEFIIDKIVEIKDEAAVIPIQPRRKPRYPRRNKHFRNPGVKCAQKSRKQPSRGNNGAIHNEQGVHIETGLDLCDCLVTTCDGCFFPCQKCGSNKCGLQCRVLRKYAYEEVEYEGYFIVKHPIHSKKTML